MQKPVNNTLYATVLCSLFGLIVASVLIIICYLFSFNCWFGIIILVLSSFTFSIVALIDLIKSK